MDVLHEEHDPEKIPDYDEKDDGSLPLPGFDDPNFDTEEAIHGVFDEDSPYPEVRCAVANTDDPEIPVSTVRSWVLGITWSILIAGLNQFFSFRYPSVSIDGIVAQLLSYPIGRAWARYVPNVTILGISLNPGPFSIKEHVLITIMASVGASSASATDLIAVQRIYYKQIYHFGFQWMVVISTQMIGVSICGISLRYLVDPPSMIWPANLVTCTLFNTLHSQKYAGMSNRKGISRERFFLICFIGSAVYYIIPGYLFQALSIFSWVCWIAPRNVIVNQLFGFSQGLGMSLISFDWAQIAYIGSPLATPWWAQANIMAGFVFFYWFFTPILYYTNVWNSQYMPIWSRDTFDNTGKSYNVTRIINADASLNVDAYEAYSPLFISTTFAVSYGLAFASIPAILTHVFLFHRKQLWTQATRALHEQPDIHARLMMRYKQVPQWYYLVIFVIMFVFGVICIELLESDLPVWAFILSLVLAIIYVIPIGIIQAITNHQMKLTVITELVIGYALPGKPIAMMLFKAWGHIMMHQALTFASDFKLGHYMKIPPRTMFFAQILGAIVAATVQLAVQAWMFANIPEMCNPHQRNGFVCFNIETLGSTSIFWGVIGPARQFSKGQIYYALTFFFPLGVLLPLIPWFLVKRFPNSWIRFLNFPIILAGTNRIPFANAVNYVTWGIVGFVFQYIIRRRHFSWWSKYNYILSAGLDAGVALSVVFIFFCLQYPRGGSIGQNIQTWWGNTAFVNTADYLGTPLKKLENGQSYFGPSTW